MMLVRDVRDRDRYRDGEGGEEYLLYAVEM